jgi:ribonuclease HI
MPSEYSPPDDSPDLASRAPRVSPNPGPNAEKITVYTDGSASSNGKGGTKAGAGIFYDEEDTRNRAIRVPDELKPSNQVAELLAIKEVLESTPLNVPLDIISDSKYAIEGLTKHLPL